MEKSSLDFLKKLLTTPSVTSQEARGIRVWVDYVKKFADRVETDAYGNAYAYLNEKGTPKVMLTGHADEIGFMVRHVDDNGFIYMAGVGGVDRALVRGQRVHIHTRKGPVLGVTGSIPVHLQDHKDDHKKVPELHEIFIDIGAKNKKEALKKIEIGDTITYVDDFEILSGTVAVARGFDNRIGTYAAAEALRQLSRGKKPNACVVAVATVQEEIGLNGAAMASYNAHPDVALVADVSHSLDVPGLCKAKFGETTLGKGPILGLGSANHPVVIDRLRAVARTRKIPLQASLDPNHTSTDADAIAVSRGGIPTACVGLPTRYMHSPVESVDLRDLDQLVLLMAAFAGSLSKGERFKVRI
jgi:putative aminopeptidase FrvX